MPPTPIPPDEPARLAALRSYDVLDTAGEANFDSITRLAAHVTGTSIALVSLVDTHRLWFKSYIGETSGIEVPREGSFCAHAITAPDQPFVVRDARHDPRFADHPSISGPPYLRAYAGIPLVNPEGYALGALAVLDTVPRAFSESNLESLRMVAGAAMTTLELRRAMSRMRILALTDDLTGLPNRPAILAELSRAIARQQRDARPFSLLYLDLDGFKQVNDRQGHAVGDQVLARLGAVLRCHLRPSDTAARIGGDEFAAVLVGGSAEDARRTAERVRAGIAEAMSLAGWRITASIGAVTFIDPPRDPAAAIIQADRYMYAAKQSGGNRVASHAHFQRGGLLAAD